jgi:hypothetical protein
LQLIGTGECLCWRGEARTQQARRPRAGHVTYRTKALAPVTAQGHVHSPGLLEATERLVVPGRAPGSACAAQMVLILPSDERREGTCTHNVGGRFDRGVGAPRETQLSTRRRRRRRVASPISDRHVGHPGDAVPKLSSPLSSFASSLAHAGPCFVRMQRVGVDRCCARRGGAILSPLLIAVGARAHGGDWYVASTARMRCERL